MVTPFPSAGSGPIGGVQSVAATLCDALTTQEGLGIHVLSLGSDVDESIWDRGGVHVHQIRYRQRAAAFLGFSGAVALVADEVARLRPDIVHGQGLGPEGVAVSRLVRVPTCVTPHGDVDRDVIGNVRGLTARMNATARLYLAKEALSRFDAAVSISGSRDLGLAKRVVLIPNPIDPIYYSPLSDHPRNGLAVVASIKRIKQIHHVFVAAESLGVSPSIEITVAGATENAAYLKELKALAESCTHIRVSWSGRLDALGLKSLYDRSKALVLASQWEISPLCVAEAMVRRCPVIVPDHPGTCELVGGGERGSMYAAGSVDQLSRAIRTALLSPDSVIEMTRAAQEWAVPRFDVSAVAQDTAALYRSLTS